MLAQSYIEVGQHPRAAKSFQACLDLNPGDVPARYRQAKLSLRDGQSDRARQELQKILELQPDHAAARKQLAQLEPRQ